MKSTPPASGELLPTIVVDIVEFQPITSALPLRFTMRLEPADTKRIRLEQAHEGQVFATDRRSKNPNDGDFPKVSVTWGASNVGTLFPVRFEIRNPAYLLAGIALWPKASNGVKEGPASSFQGAKTNRSTYDSTKALSSSFLTVDNFGSRFQHQEGPAKETFSFVLIVHQTSTSQIGIIDPDIENDYDPNHVG